MNKEETRLECLRLAIPLTSAGEEDRIKNVAKIASLLYAFVVDEDVSSTADAETSPDRTLRLKQKK